MYTPWYVLFQCPLDLSDYSWDEEHGPFEEDCMFDWGSSTNCKLMKKPLTESRIVSNYSVAPVDMKNSLKLSGSYTVSALLTTMS